MKSEFLASSWKKFRGRGILNHTPVLCDTVSWVKRFVVRLSTTERGKEREGEKLGGEREEQGGTDHRGSQIRR